MVIAIPSFRILKTADTLPTPDVYNKSCRVANGTGVYSIPDHGNIEFDSNMIQDKDLKPGQIRLLEVDNRVIVPEGSVIKFLITTSDVIHSFAIPSLGIKTDAVPGRVNQTWTKIDKKEFIMDNAPGIMRVNHGFMPIAIEVVSKEDFQQWVAKSKMKLSMQ